MSYSFAVVPVAVADFADAAAKAKDAFTEGLAVSDYSLTDDTSAQIDKAIAAAASLASDLYGSSGVYVGGGFVGHVNEDNGAGTSCSITLSTSAAPVDDVTQTQPS